LRTFSTIYRKPKNLPLKGGLGWGKTVISQLFQTCVYTVASCRRSFTSALFIVGFKNPEKADVWTFEGKNSTFKLKPNVIPKGKTPN
jgi:hypothetical protein